MAVVYLVFNEGYAATAGDALVRRELCAEAIRLGRLSTELMPRRAGPGSAARAHAAARRAAGRAGRRGRRARAARRAGSHALGPTPRSTRGSSWWSRLYDAPRLSATRSRRRSRRCTPANRAARRRPTGRESPRSMRCSKRSTRRRSWRLNRAVAIAMAEGPRSRSTLLDALEEDLAGYHLRHAARADLLRRLGPPRRGRRRTTADGRARGTTPERRPRATLARSAGSE